MRRGHGVMLGAAGVLALVLGSGCTRPGATEDEDESGRTEEVEVEVEGAGEGVPAPAPVWEPTALAEALALGREALVRVQCHRCHLIDDVPRPPEAQDCLGCHQKMEALGPLDPLHAQLTVERGEGTVERYQRSLTHFVESPDLSGIARRLRLDWLREYVRAPYDVRPMLEESMVRSRVADKDVEAMVRYFAAVADVPDPYEGGVFMPAAVAPPSQPTEARLEQAADLFVEKGCGGCHTLGNISTGRSVDDLRAVGLAARMAPNLRFTRSRMDPETVVAFLVEPRSVSPRSLMPTLGLTREEAELLRDYVFFADPRLPDKPPAPDLEPPPLLRRTVRYAEVKERVLNPICAQCHRNAHETVQGPGSDSGFGWIGENLRMRTYESLVDGALGGDGSRFSVLEPRPGAELPFLVEIMLRRRGEALRDHLEPFQDHPLLEGDPGGEPAMPMGLPPISDEDIALVRTWIAQGCRGPREVIGQVGIRDGDLVADGPIEVNRGCQQRSRSADRPAWAAGTEPATEPATEPGGSP